MRSVVIIGELWASGSDGFRVKFPGSWLRSRAFRVRLMTPEARIFGEPRRIARGPPPGGGSLPSLRRVILNRIRDLILGSSAKRDFVCRSNAQVEIPAFADGTVVVLTHPDPHFLRQEAHMMKGDTMGSLGVMGLHPGGPKCRNLAVSPNCIFGRLF